MQVRKSLEMFQIYWKERPNLFFKRAKELLKEHVPNMLLQMAINAETLIKTRVIDKGKDIHGNKFQKYSEKYRKYKERRTGKSWKNKVDLFGVGKSSGHLMNSLHSRIMSTSKAILSVIGHPAVYGLAHQIGIPPMPKREWFGLTSSESDLIEKMFKKRIEKLLEDVNK